MPWSAAYNMTCYSADRRFYVFFFFFLIRFVNMHVRVQMNVYIGADLYLHIESLIFRLIYNALY